MNRFELEALIDELEKIAQIPTGSIPVTKNRMKQAVKNIGTIGTGIFVGSAAAGLLDKLVLNKMMKQPLPPAAKAVILGGLGLGATMAGSSMLAKAHMLTDEADKKKEAYASLLAGGLSGAVGGAQPGGPAGIYAGFPAGVAGGALGRGAGSLGGSFAGLGVGKALKALFPSLKMAPIVGAGMGADFGRVAGTLGGGYLAGKGAGKVVQKIKKMSKAKNK